MKDEVINKQTIRCYDNGGKTMDRYTVVYIGQLAVIGRNDLYECVGMSAAPFHPQGFGQHSAAMPGKHLGKRIPFAELPDDCRALVMCDLKTHRIMQTSIICALDASLTFVSDSQDVQAIREHVGSIANGYDSFFVRIADGDYTEVWGICGIVPYNSKLASRLI